ncbi:PTS IIA-like nitrogen-regulatory protein PtsN [Alteromonadaceae bacterium M269]|nr:PTS IIA-like nitrogen-regulatory protein PtsN [Alteromonadaceae bacterium M269]
MEIKTLLSPHCTHCAVEATSKKRILESISELVHKHSSVNADIILNSLISREKVGSTGIGNGIAIPHGRLADINEIQAMLITCDKAVAYDAIDDQPVDIFFVLLVPEDQTHGHLQTLATVAKALSDKQVVKRIRAARTDDELYEAIV